MISHRLYRCQTTESETPTDNDASPSLDTDEQIKLGFLLEILSFFELLFPQSPTDLTILMFGFPRHTKGTVTTCCTYTVEGSASKRCPIQRNKMNQ